MDPITRASRAFLAEADAFWHADKGPLLPMIADVSSRPDLVKTLRLAELALENRRPLFLYEAPFTAVRAWSDGLASVIAEDYEALREGAAKEGVTFSPFPPATLGPGENHPPLARAVWAMDHAAALLASRLDGVLVALLPAQIEDARAYRDAIATLAATRLSLRVRLAVHHPPGGPLEGVLGGEGARFEVDPTALTEYLKQLGTSGESQGPPVPPPPAPTEEQKRAFEAKAGRKLPSPETGRTLRTLLLDGATATGRRDHEAAASHYREARLLCQREGLPLEEATLLLALGGACLSWGLPELASDAFEQAAAIAQALDAWPLVCQAWLGVGGAQLTAKQYEAAAVAYGSAAEAAKRAEIAILGVEALRLSGTCYLLCGRQQEAMRAWLQAVELGTEIAVEERAASTFPQVAEALATRLGRRGLSAQAAHVRSLLTAAAAPVRDEPFASADPLNVPLGADTGEVPVLPFASSRPADDAGTATLVGVPSPLRPVLPFEPGGHGAADEPTR